VIAAEFRRRTTKSHSQVLVPGDDLPIAVTGTFDHDSITLRTLAAPRRRRSAGISWRFAERVGV